MISLYLAILRDPRIPNNKRWEIFQHLKEYKFIRKMPKPVTRFDVTGTPTLKLSDFTLVPSELEAFIKKADYRNRFPKYTEEFGEPRQPKGILEHKYAEQFLSLMIPDWESFAKDDIIIDVAASNSPFQEVLIGWGYENTYKTDLNYRTSEEHKTIGCNANDMSYFKDGTVTLIASHNSWEHFEADSDIAFLHECARILKPGGKVVILPLLLYEEGVNLTDPSIWLKKYRNAPEHPIFDPKFAINFDVYKQRLEKFYSPQALSDALEKVDCDFEIVRVENGDGNGMVLVGTKRS